MSKAPYLEFRGIGKTFPGVKALQDISFGCQAGQVHALMGENGAGKSTLLKILAGNYAPSSGTITIDDQPVAFGSTSHALAAGIAIIYQELHLLPELTVAENMYLGQLPRRAGLIDWPTLFANAQKGLDYLGIDIDARAQVKSLPIGQRQMVEIAKALTRDAKIIAFDEPTSSLSAREIEQLFRVIHDLRDNGRVILYVSHRMEEIFQISDQITVFKDGRYVKTFDDMAHVTNDDLIKAMVGRDVGDIYGYAPRDYGPVRLEIEGMLAPGLKVPVNLQVHQGEIVGLFGLVGAGRTELMKALFGASRIQSGNIRIDGEPAAITCPIDAIKRGLVLCPEDRKAEGIVGIHTVRDNINISARRKTLKIGCFINGLWERANAKRRIEQLNVKTPSDQQLLVNLSGGNQQKVILGRWLSEDIKCILLDEPTRGIDVGAKHEIYNIIYGLAKQGVAVVFVSSDLPEVLGVSDRIVVMREGRIVGELSHTEATEEKALHLAMVREPVRPAA